MTTEKMPDVINVGLLEVMGERFLAVLYHETKIVPILQDKYLRAEPVEELLKSVRKELWAAVNFLPCDNMTQATTRNNAVRTLSKIDKFLGEK